LKTFARDNARLLRTDEDVRVPIRRFNAAALDKQIDLSPVTAPNLTGLPIRFS
jgi:hypothetical protein